ncbi:MAG: hypothetical protein ABI794_11965 [Betaproteobacteria bacterium]
MNPLALATKRVVPMAALLLVAGCAITDRSALDASWSAPDRPQTGFRKVLILTVARDEFVQAEFQDRLAARLVEHGMNAIASHRYFTRYNAEGRSVSGKPSKPPMPTPSWWCA